jgi:hypothetical protein
MQTSALDDYLKQVEMYLPPWTAKDIVQEIRSHVLDQAEGMAAERGVAVDEAILREALASLGPPQQLAAGYVPAVTLIRPEYTLPFAIYSVALTVLLIPLLFAGGLGAWLLAAVVAVGLLFVGFVLLSRMARVVRLPIWHPRLGEVSVKVDMGQALRRGVHTIWPQPAMAAMASGPLDPQAVRPAILAPGVSGVSGGASGGMSGAAGVSGGEAGSWPPPAARAPRRTPTEWLIAHSGPRPLRIHELFGAGMRAVFGFALALFFAFAASRFPILDLRFDDPQQGWRLVFVAPGLGAVRELGAIACMATCLSGLLPIFLGKCRMALYGMMASQVAWAILLYRLMTGGEVFALAFTTNGWVENDWPQVHAAIQSGVPLVFAGWLLVTLLALVGSLVRLGMMEAWHRSQREP